jgi:DNA-binding transcriptional MerR regulator
MDDRLLTSSKAAELINVSSRTLEGWRRKGLGPPYLVYSARCIRYSERAVDDWLALQSNAHRKSQPRKQPR